MDASCEVSVERARALQQLIDPDAPPLRSGDPLPALWHWASLPRWADPGATGPDGHPQRSGPLADVTATRRMFAGGLVEYLGGPLRLGDTVSVRSSVVDVVAKSGRSGEFVLATSAIEVVDDAGVVRVRERQDVVYTAARPAPDADRSGALPIVGRPLVARADGGFDLRTDPTVLLRFSAITANAHRIHYDQAYATEVEQLPGLLVHGPFIAVALVHAARRATNRDDVERVEHRSLNPLFCGQPARTTVEAGGAGQVAELIGPGDAGAATKARVTVRFAT